jgi:ABC-type transport system involved in multi-copper enzyme maturation permease subunit
MLTNLFTNERQKMMQRPMFWVMLAIMALLVLCSQGAIFTLLKVEMASQEPSAELVESFNSFFLWPEGLTNVLGFAGGGQFGGLLLVVLVGAITAQEYGWRTMHLWLSRGVSRPMLMGAKLLNVLLAALLIVLVTALTGGIVTGLLNLIEFGSLPVEQVDFLAWGMSILRVTYTLLPYGALAFFLAVAFRSPVAAIGGSLAYTLLIEGIAIQLLSFAGGAIGKIGQYLPGGMAYSLLQHNRAGHMTIVVNNQAAEIAMLDPIPAAIGIGLWTLLFAALAVGLFARQDLAE